MLHAANEGASAATRALDRLLAELKKEPPQFLSTIAINFWSPYLPSGRYTALEYPRTSAGDSVEKKYGGKERLRQIHHRYLTLLGRNLSANHLLVEVENVCQIIVDATAPHLDGPSISGATTPAMPVTLRLDMPLSSPDSDPCFRTLVPPANYEKWLDWLTSAEYERRYQGPLRKELLDRRLAAREELPEAFTAHLAVWIRKKWVPPHIGLGDFDDRWLARIQLTALAAAIWGDVWVSHALSLGNAAHRRLRLQASCTVTGRPIDHAPEGVEGFRTNIADFAQRCAQRLESLVLEEFEPVATEVEALEHDPWEPQLRNVANRFSHDLGGSLIGHDHEREHIRLRGLLTPGLDALRIGPTQILVLHEIDPDEFGPLVSTEDHVNRWWDTWKAYFASNDLFLGRDRVALHFELGLTQEGATVIPIPRHVVQITSSLQELLRSAGDPGEGLLQLGFQSDRTMALHVRFSPGPQGPILETRVHRKGEEFTWTATPTIEPDWGALRDALCQVIKLVRSTLRDVDLFKNAAFSLLTLSEGQIAQLSDGIAELRRMKRGCLVFIGPVYHRQADDTYWFMKPDALKTRVEITRLGVLFPIVSQVPETFSEDFRSRFADAAAMDGETIVFTAHPDGPCPPRGFDVDRPPGTTEACRFVQLPEGTPPLLETRGPKISSHYEEAWKAAADVVKQDYLAGVDGVDCVPISKLQRTDLLSLGTRHRKAAMTTMKVDSIVGITCSASGKLKVWVKGVPIAEICPQTNRLLPHLSRPETPQEPR